MTWPKTADGQYYRWNLLIPVNQVGGMATLLLSPNGNASLVGVPAIETGPPGIAPVFDTAVNITPLTHDDVTPDSMSLTLLTPATPTTPAVYRLNATSRAGQDGTDGDTVLDPGDYGTPVAKQMLVVNGALTGFQYQTQKVGDTYWPATISNTPTGNPSFTLAQVSIPAQDFDWRPDVEAGTIIAGTGSNLQVDLVARLTTTVGATAASGNDVGRGFGVAGQNDRLTLISGPPAGSPDNWNRVPAGSAAVIYLRVERQFGSDTFSTAAVSTRFSVKVNPIL